MTPSTPQEQPTSDTHYAVADFTRELIEDVARDRYSLGAWGIFLSRSWARSLDDIRAASARALSSIRWTVLGAAIGTGVIFLAVTTHSPRVALLTAMLWLPWYAGAVFFLFTHLGMVDDDSGRPHMRLLLPINVSIPKPFNQVLVSVLEKCLSELTKKSVGVYRSTNCGKSSE